MISSSQCVTFSSGSHTVSNNHTGSSILLKLTSATVSNQRSGHQPIITSQKMIARYQSQAQEVFLSLRSFPKGLTSTQEVAKHVQELLRKEKGVGVQFQSSGTKSKLEEVTGTPINWKC